MAKNPLSGLRLEIRRREDGEEDEDVETEGDQEGEAENGENAEGQPAEA